MPSSLYSPAYLAQLASSGVSQPVVFVVMAFANETLYLFSGIGKITPAGPAFNPLSTFPYGQTWTGVGWLGKISAIPQTTKIQAQNVTFSLPGIPSELTSDAAYQVRITGTATVFVGFIDSSGNVILDPIQRFAGALDVSTLGDSGATSTISITAENPLLSLNEAPDRKFDDMDQQIYAPGDLGFSFVDQLANKQTFWPSPASWASVYPLNMVLSPSGADIAVGGTVTIQARINYNDGSYYEKPSGLGSGPHWVGAISSSNPKIATADILTAIVTGQNPGVCSIMVRALSSSFSPLNEMKATCTVIVHS